MKAKRFEMAMGASIVAVAVMFALTAGRAEAFREYPIGESVEKHAMRIAAVWLPPVQMDNDKRLDDLRKKKDGQSIHLEEDVHSIEANENGFGAGEWIPYLKISYTLKDGGKTISGEFVPMVAKDGPHYGAQVYVPFGRYRLTYHISPPSASGFGRHTDPVTGVAGWWEPFEVSWDFDFKGVRK